MRVRDVTHVPGPSGGYTLERFYLDQLFTLYVGGGKQYADFHVLADGQELAVKRTDPVVLRSAGLPGFLPWPDGRSPGGWLLLLVVCGSGAALLVVLMRVAERLEVPRRPVPAGLALCLVTVLAVPPLPAYAGGGGGGPTTSRRWLLNDPLGSATVLLTPDGLAEREVLYRPFGGIYAETGGDPDATIFAGHRLERNSDLYYMQARWQDPETGTFVSVDPVVADGRDPQSYNAYAYARNNPISYSDPTGMNVDDWPDGIEVRTVYAGPPDPPPAHIEFDSSSFGGSSNGGASGAALAGIGGTGTGTGAGLGNPPTATPKGPKEPDESKEEGFKVKLSLQVHGHDVIDTAKDVAKATKLNDSAAGRAIDAVDQARKGVPTSKPNASVTIFLNYVGEHGSSPPSPSQPLTTPVPSQIGNQTVVGGFTFKW